MAHTRTDAPGQGRPALHVFFAVPAEEEMAFDAMIVDHQAFMVKTHSMGTGGAAPRVLEYSWSKGAALNNPMDPKEGTTGEIWYTLCEIYPEASDIVAHFEVAGEQWPGLATLQDFIGKYAKHVDRDSAVLTCMSDGDLAVCSTKVGNPSINVAYVVPSGIAAGEEWPEETPEKVQEMDTFFEEHEKFMRNTHTFAPAADDATQPRLTQFTISKIKQQEDPLDPEKGFTGNVVYIMNEAYVAPSGIAGHMALGGSEEHGFAENFAKMMAMNEQNATFLQAGACVVVATMYSLGFEGPMLKR